MGCSGTREGNESLGGVAGTQPPRVLNLKATRTLSVHRDESLLKHSHYGPIA